MYYVHPQHLIHWRQMHWDDGIALLVMLFLIALFVTTLGASGVAHVAAGLGLDASLAA